MTQTSSTLTETGSPTQHAMLIVWGEFAREIGLMDHLRGGEDTAEVRDSCAV